MQNVLSFPSGSANELNRRQEVELGFQGQRGSLERFDHLARVRGLYLPRVAITELSSCLVGIRDKAGNTSTSELAVITGSAIFAHLTRVALRQFQACVHYSESGGVWKRVTCL